MKDRKISFLLLLSLFSTFTMAQDAKNLKPNGSPSLSTVRSIYVQPMSDGLNNYITRRLIKWGKIKVVSSPELADAVLMGDSESRTTGSISDGSGGIYTATSGEVMLVAHSDNSAIWSTKKSDHWSFGKGNSKVADRIVDQLVKDWERTNK